MLLAEEMIDLKQAYSIYVKEQKHWIVEKNKANGFRQDPDECLFMRRITILQDNKIIHISGHFLLYQSFHVNNSFITQTNNIPKNPVYQRKCQLSLQPSAKHKLNSLQCTWLSTKNIIFWPMISHGPVLLWGDLWLYSIVLITDIYQPTNYRTVRNSL